MLDRIFGPLARRWPWIATALLVQKRFGEVKGNYLAASVTLTLFLSLFPLLLVAIAIVGFFTSRETGFSDEIIQSLGLTGPPADYLTSALQQAADSKKAASIVGLLGLLWSGLSLVAAIEYTLDTTWQVTGRGIKDKARGLGWSAGALVLVLTSVGLSASIDYLTDGFVFGVLSVVIALGINFVLWMWSFLILSFHRVHWKAYVPGAVAAAAGLELLKGLASQVPSLFSGSGAIYGPLGIVFVILTILLLVGRLIVYASILNVVRWEEDHGTTTIDIEVPRVPGQVPTEADRTGAVDPT